ncbi:hypothetical protein B0J17DRAFT_737092 [Rhizoctonia solani]|nr:hypothetical protein B0J17DRAFT_737092 [Rhizoctonia solani]
MIDQLGSAGDQLRIAWDSCLQIYLGINNKFNQGNLSLTNHFPSELNPQLEAESAFISSYEPKLQEITVVFKRVRNYCSGRAPINTLPPEILTRIFHLVGAEPCKLRHLSKSSTRYFPKYPDYLAQGRNTRRARAGELPIELHIYGETDNESDNLRRDHSKLLKLIHFISSRAIALELVVDITEELMENGFAALTKLHLCGLFPLWSSRAYHGLVDLRLLSTPSRAAIQKKSLMIILHSSPGLQILHFGLRIWSDFGEVTPVHLQDLHVIKIFPYNFGETKLCPGKLVRLLAPGSKQLRLSFEGYYMRGATLITELERFLELSRLERFYSKVVYPPIIVLLQFSAFLERVVFDDIRSAKISSEWLEMDELRLLPRLRSLHVTRSIVSESHLRLLFDCCPDGMVIQCCHVNRDDSEQKLSASELADTFPSVRITERTPYPPDNPTADWDIIDRGEELKLKCPRV